MKMRSAFLVLTLALAGCGVGRVGTPPSVFDLGADLRPALQLPARAPIALAYVGARAVGLRHHLARRRQRGAKSYATYRWASSPSDLVRQRLTERLSRQGPVLGERVNGQTPQLQVQLQQFEQVFAPDGASSQGRVVLQAVLVNGHRCWARPASPSRRPRRRRTRPAGGRAAPGDRRRRRPTGAMAGDRAAVRRLTSLLSATPLESAHVRTHRNPGFTGAAPHRLRRRLARRHAAGWALVLHPHPLQGGARENKVVTTIARACVQHGLVAVRPNSVASACRRRIRQVRGRDPRHAGPGGAGARAASRAGAGALGAGRFSFGTAVAAQTYAALAEQGDAPLPSALMLMGPAVNRFQSHEVQVRATR